MTDQHLPLEEKLYKYLSLALLNIGYLPDNIYFGYQDGAALTGNHVIMNIAEISEDLPPEIRDIYLHNPAQQIEENIIYRNKVTISVDVRGDNILQNAQRLKALFFSTEMKELAQKLTLGFVRYTPTRTIPIVLKNRHQMRAVFDLEIYHTEIETIAISTIGSVRIIGHDQLNRELMDKTITEP